MARLANLPKIHLRFHLFSVLPRPPQLRKYLSQRPCSTQSAEQVVNLLSRLSKFSLTKKEKLQLLNLAPKGMVEYYLIIEDCDTRFNETQIGEIMEIVSECLDAQSMQQ